MEKFCEGYPNVKINYFADSGSNCSARFENVKKGQGKNKDLFGPELGLAKALSSFYPYEDVYIVKWACFANSG